MRYDAAFARLPAGSYLSGYWQSAAYFQGVEQRQIAGQQAHQCLTP